MPLGLDRKRLLLLVKSALAVVVIAAVGLHFARLVDRPEVGWIEWTPRGWLLIPAALLYVAAQATWGLFWWLLLRGQGTTLPLGSNYRAYFLSQFGKYVPGKAWVVLIRVSLLRGHVSAAVAGLTATFETLTAMAAGAGLGVVLLPTLDISEELFPGQAFAFAAIALIPVGLIVLQKLVLRIAEKFRKREHLHLRTPTLLLLMQGLLLGSIGWCCLGLSLWLTITALYPSAPGLDGATFLRCIGINCLAYVAGFAVLFTPGGAGVRELLLQQLLTPFLFVTAGDAAAGHAVMIAIVLRFIWTLAEVLTAGFLYLCIHPLPTAEPFARPTPLQTTS